MKNRVAALRKEKHMSQKELVRILGVSRQTVSSIENGRYDPSLPLAFDIAEALGEPIERIFLPSGPGAARTQGKQVAELSR